MSKTTITETYTLPSKGRIYTPKIDARVTLRSMTTQEEMKRLSPTDAPYKVMASIIEDCIVDNKLGMPVYDLYIGDYTYLLHRLRVVTYGPQYKMAIQCPNCGAVTVPSINLDNIEVKEYTDDFADLLIVNLPITDKRIELNIQTPRRIEEANFKVKELKKRHKDLMYDPSLPVSLQSFIKTVDGQVLRDDALESFVKQLPMGDTNVLLQAVSALNGKVGLDTEVVATCKECGYDSVSTFRITSEFFGPTKD